MGDRLTMQFTDTLVVVTCVCGLNYAIPEALNSQLLDHPREKSVHCPLGHTWHYEGKSDAERERERNARLVAALDQAQARAVEAEKRRIALQGQLTKARKRAAAAVCPVPGCKRRIVQMANHLASKHPDWHPDHE